MSEKECLHGSTSEHCAYCMSDAEQKHQATFAALVEVARAADVVHHLRLRFALAKNVSEQRIILNQMNVAWNRYADAAARLNALNPKLLEKEN